MKVDVTRDKEGKESYEGTAMVSLNAPVHTLSIIRDEPVFVARILQQVRFYSKTKSATERVIMQCRMMLTYMLYSHYAACRVCSSQ